MLIILSQKIDTESSYSDQLFKNYNYPCRYRNQIHEGDTFIYYQGNRYTKDQRYYFGVGTIGKISQAEDTSYNAELINVHKFENIVPIYLSEGKYVEQLGYDTIRKSPTPPWQSSIRPLSQEAFDYIITASGIHDKLFSNCSVEDLKHQLKSQIRDFYLGDNINAILEIEQTILEIKKVLNLKSVDSNEYTENNIPNDSINDFFKYCKTTPMSYSYKPVLIITFFKCVNQNGVMKIDDCIPLIRQFYQNRRDQNLPVEKNNCIYLKSNISDGEIKRNLIANPIKALSKSNFFLYNKEEEELSFTSNLWPSIGLEEKLIIDRICRQRLAKYYRELKSQ